MSGSNKRPEMERITTPELAEKFIAEQLEALRAQIGSGKVLLALSGGVDFVRRGSAAHQGGGQAARVRAREPRPDAQGRERAGHRGVPQSARREPDVCRRRGPLPGQAGGRRRAGAQAQDNRRRVHPGVRGGGPQAGGHQLPRPGHDISGHHRVRPGEESPQRRRPAGGPEV